LQLTNISYIISNGFMSRVLVIELMKITSFLAAMFTKPTVTKHVFMGTSYAIFCPNQAINL